MKEEARVSRCTFAQWIGMEYKEKVHEKIQKESAISSLG